MKYAGKRLILVKTLQIMIKKAIQPCKRIANAMESSKREPTQEG